MINSTLNTILISVIIPAYNSEKTIKETIQSVLKQTFTNFELIIINDGSQDSTIKVIAEIKDSRIKAFSYSHAGGNVSRNRGLHLAVGEFVSFLDADDLWTPDKLQSQLKALQENITAKVAYSWTDYINENGEFILSGKRINLNENVYESLLLNNFLENGSNPLICRKALIKSGGFDESLSAAQDWDMWLRLASKFDFICVPSVQILYRISGNSVSSNLVRQEKSCLQVLKRAYKERFSLQDAPARSTLKHNWNISLANLYKYLTCKALQKPFNKKKGIAAAIFLWKYFLYDPSRLQNINFTLKLSLKIFIIFIVPTLLDNITKQREVRKQEAETLLNAWVVEKRSENTNGYQVQLLSLVNSKNLLNNDSSSGFTLLETLVVVLLIGILATLAIPNWLSFVQTRHLNTAQNEVYYAMRQAQSQASKEKLTWQASFREQNSILQWAVHPATVNASNANWNNLNSNVRLDAETTLSESNGIRQIQFDYRGNVRQPPLGRITLSSKYGGKTKRCVVVSTILGAMRMEKDHTAAENGKYCY